MAAAQAQIQSGSMVNNMGMGVAGTGMLNAGGMGHTPDQQQYFMQQMAQMQAQQQQRQQAQMGLGIGMDNIAGGFQQLEQVSSSHGVGGFGGDSAAAAGGGGGLNHPGAFMQQPAGVGSVDKDSSNGNSIPSAPAMVPMNVINPSGGPLDADAQAQQDRLIQQQQLLQQQHQKLLEQQELLRQLQEQQRALQQQQMQAVQLEQQQQNMAGGVNMANMAGMAGMTDFPGVPGGIGAMNPAMMQNMQQQQQQQQQPQSVSAGSDNGPAENVSGLLNQQEQTVPMKPPAPSGGAGAGRTNRRGSLTFDDLVKGIKSAKAAQKMGMSSTNMSLSVGDIDSNLSSAFEDSLIISVEGSLANSSNSEKKPAAAAGVGGANVAQASQNRPTQSNGPGGVPENVTVNQQQQPGSGPMGESSMLRGMAMSDAGMSFSLSDAADLLGGSVMQMSYRGFPESKQDDQGK